MLPTLVKAPFANPAWIFEPKWDGFRALCYIADGEARLISRRRNDLTKRFPTLQSIAGSIKVESLTEHYFADVIVRMGEQSPTRRDV